MGFGAQATEQALTKKNLECLGIVGFGGLGLQDSGGGVEDSGRGDMGSSFH